MKEILYVCTWKTPFLITLELTTVENEWTDKVLFILRRCGKSVKPANFRNKAEGTIRRFQANATVSIFQSRKRFLNWQTRNSGIWLAYT